MAVKIKTPAGMIDIANDVIATVVGGAATDNYVVVGMASRNPLKDGVNQILGRDSFHQGVVIRQQDNGIAVDVYIIVGYGTKISAVSKSVQEKVIRFCLVRSVDESEWTAGMNCHRKKDRKQVF